MKGKSWQRFILSLVMVLGYFAVIGYTLYRGDAENAKALLTALPPMVVAVVAVWTNQAGKEAEKKETPPNA